MMNNVVLLPLHQLERSFNSEVIWVIDLQSLFHFGVNFLAVEYMGFYIFMDGLFPPSIDTHWGFCIKPAF